MQVPQDTNEAKAALPILRTLVLAGRVEADAARITVCVESVPSPDNPRTSRLAPLSVLACLRGLNSTLRAGS